MFHGEKEKKKLDRAQVGARHDAPACEREHTHTHIYSGRKAGRMSRDFPLGAEPPTEEHLSLLFNGAAFSTPKKIISKIC